MSATATVTSHCCRGAYGHAYLLTRCASGHEERGGSAEPRKLDVWASAVSYWGGDLEAARLRSIHTFLATGRGPPRLGADSDAFLDTALERA